MHDQPDINAEQGWVLVPNLIGTPWRQARQLADDCGLCPTSDNPDGPPLAELGWPGGVVAAQHPQSGTRVRRGDKLRLQFLKPPQGPDMAGDREPRHPSPSPLTLTAEALPEHDRDDVVGE